MRSFNTSIRRRKIFSVLAVALAVPVLIMAALTAAPAQGAPKATCTVTNANDTGAGSLRDCISTAASGDTINFSSSGPITVTSAPLAIPASKRLTIDGTGLSITLNGAGSSSVITVSVNATLTLQSVTVANGMAAGGNGGGLYNNGTLTVTNATLSNNTATFISGSSGYGGAIYNHGTLNVINTLIVSNTAVTGGGIENTPGMTANISKSTLSNNSGANTGGGIDNSGGTVNLTNATLYSNTVKPSGFGGGVYNTAGGTLNGLHVTLSANSANQGGGVYNSSTATMTNTVWASNTATVSGGNCVGTIGDGGGNLRFPSGDTSCVGTSANPDLGALANNGGPTPTMALLTGSGAIALDSANCAATDQRGVPRPSTCDSGAYQTNHQAGPNFVVNDLADTDDGACDALAVGATNCTLREAMNAANAVNTNDTITFALSGTITLGSTLPTVVTAATAGRMTIDGMGQVITISGNNAVGVMSNPSGAILKLQNLTIANGKALQGGGIYNEGTLTVTQSTIYSNSATLQGGGIYSFGGSVALTDVTFAGNSAAGSNGGGMFNDVGSATLTNVTFSGNSAFGGGGMADLGASETLTNVTFSGNTDNGPGGGGGMFNSFASPTLTNVTFSGNSTFGSGSAMWNESFSSPTIRNSILWGDPGGGSEISNEDGDSSPTVSYSIVQGGSVYPGTGNLNTDPKLLPLANNGGPTFTMALGLGSSAFNLAVGNCPAADQRGVTRPRAPSRCDSGAYQSVLAFLPLIQR